MSLRNEKWPRVKQLFQSALEREPANRCAFLDEVCADDDELRLEVVSLLESDALAENFIEHGVLENDDELFADARDKRLAGHRFGAYKIVREIGRGGMGTVYLAERADDAYRKQVAIKLVKRGFDTDNILRRFRYERQILANLDHPNIARLLDGGALDDGRPYFVMEYVEGVPVTDYCDQRRLSINERLKLFRTACAAVQHAHQNLVIHRDLKPGNILVTRDGAPKLLDFGIAKLLDADASTQHAETTAALRILTPDYASPEQARGASVTTATDVYSLGVVLYELLTGHRPHHLDHLRPDEIARRLSEDAPERPSVAVNRTEETDSTDGLERPTLTPELVSRTREGQPEKLRRRLRGDLDNIVLMAMRKEPARRYASVGQFSEDIRRYLEGLPVIARPDTFRYRATKFVKRHAVGVAAAMLVVLSLLVGITVSVWQARVARVEAANAARVSSFMRDIFLLANQRFNSPGRNLKGDKMSASDLLDEASKRIDTELVDQPDVRAELHHTIGDTYLTFHRFDAAEQNFRAALTLSREAYGERNPKVANELYHLAAVLQWKDELSEADQLYRQAILMMRVTDAENANLPHMLHDYAGFRLDEYGDVEMAEPLFRESLSLFKRKYGEEYVMVAWLNNALAEVAETRNELDTAEAIYRDSLARFTRLSTDQNNRQFINQTNISLAHVVLEKGNYAEAETILRGVLGRLDKSAPGYDDLTASCDEYLAQLHYLTREYERAEAERRRELEIQQSLYRADHRGLIRTLCGLSEVLSKEGKTKEAVSRYDEAREIYDRRAGDDLKDAELKGILGECLMVQRRHAEAEPLLTESYTALNSRLGQRNLRTIEAKRRLVSLYEAWNKSEQAEQYRVSTIDCPSTSRWQETYPALERKR